MARPIKSYRPPKRTKEGTIRYFGHKSGHIRTVSDTVSDWLITNLCCNLLCALLTHFKVFIKQPVRGILIQIVVQFPARVLVQVWCFNVLPAPPPVLELPTNDR